MLVDSRAKGIPGGDLQAHQAQTIFFLSELQKDRLQNSKTRQRKAQQAPGPDDGTETNVKARLRRDSTRGRLANGLPGLFQVKLDADPQKGVPPRPHARSSRASAVLSLVLCLPPGQIFQVKIAELRSTDAKDERDKLRVGDVVQKISSGGVHKKVVQFETIEAVRNHIKGLGADMTLHVARRQLGGDGAAGSGARVAELRLTPQEQLQVGLVETVGRLRPGLFAAWTATADSEQRALMSEEDAVRLFHEIDIDKNGYIDSYELYRALSGVGVVVTTDDIRNMMADADTSGDDRIDIAEWKTLALKINALRKGSAGAVE